LLYIKCFNLRIIGYSYYIIIEFNNLLINKINMLLPISYLASITANGLAYKFAENIVKNDKKAVWNWNTFSSTLHALGISIFSSMYLNNLISINLFLVGISMSAGYMTSDLIAIYKYNMSLKWQFTIHHLSVLLGYIQIYRNDGNNLFDNRIIATALLSEISTLFLNYNKYLIKKNSIENVKNNNKFYISSTGLIASYAYFRIYNLSLIFYQFYKIQNYKYLAIMTPLTILNYVWFAILTSKYLQFYYIKNEID